MHMAIDIDEQLGLIGPNSMSVVNDIHLVLRNVRFYSILRIMSIIFDMCRKEQVF
jgi:hypothetical protein